MPNGVHGLRARFELTPQYAAAVGAEAVVAMRNDANAVAEGVTEVLAYAMAVPVATAT